MINYNDFVDNSSPISCMSDGTIFKSISDNIYVRTFDVEDNGMIIYAVGYPQIARTCFGACAKGVILGTIREQ